MLQRLNAVKSITWNVKMINTKLEIVNAFNNAFKYNILIKTNNSANYQTRISVLSSLSNN